MILRRHGYLARATVWLTSAALITAPLAAQQAAATQGSAPGAVSAEEQEEIDALYVPQDEDERGLWMQMNEVERERKESPLVIEDEDLNEYVRSVLCKTVGQAKCANARLYLVRTPQFNASMAPNGMMEVWSGLLLRVENEAQLAAVLAHEYTHFEERHSVQLFRNIKHKTNAAGFLSLIPYGSLVGLGLMTSIFGFSREMEREADRGSVRYLADAGYDTREIAVIWEHLREEMDRTAEARDTKSRKDKSGGLFGTHPPTKERVAYLTEAAAANPGTPGASGEEGYRDAMAYHWPEFVDDQIKMNDFGASEFLLESLADGRWTSGLLYARGELYRRQGDRVRLGKALEFYGEGIAQGGEIAELWRGRGLVRMKLGQPEEGRADLREYIKRSPDAADVPMIAMVAGESI